jgi:hypothetical protein
VYINPSYVVTVRPDPAQPNEVSVVKLRDGEAVRVNGYHQSVAEKLAAGRLDG